MRRRYGADCFRLCSLLMPVLVIATASGQDDLLDDLPRSGLVGHYQDAAGNSHRRVDTAMSFDWSTRSPVPHLAEGAFTVTWKGLLRVRSTGSYRFAADAIGAVAVLVNDKALFESDTSSRQWVTGDEVELRAGLHDLSIRFTKRADDASMRLFWSGSKFDWEPVNPGNMLHYSEDEPDAAMARGGALVEALRCTACHDVPGSLETLQAPAIDRLAGNLNLDWLIGRLMRAERKPSSTSKMPHFALSQPQAIAVTAYLVELSEKKHRRPKPLPKVKPPRKKGKTIVEDPVKRGEQLVVSLGCLSCHQAGELGESGLLGGGKLARSIAKRPDEFFQRWLHDPSQINKHHRMPIFELTQSEASDLASYLAEADGGATETRDPTWLGDDSLVELGKQLVQQHRCAACHSIDEELRPEAFNQRTALTAASDWTEACTGTDRLDRPNYRLHGDDQIAVEKFVRATTAIEQPTSRELDGHDLLRRSNCLACHKRGTSPGNSVTAMTVANQFAGIVEHVAALSPPSLNAIGDKFQDESLKRVIQGKAEPRRDWLSIRMPKFRLSDRQVQQLSDWFIHQDRVPQPPQTTTPSYGKDQLLAVGPRLVTSNGFGCTSCHAVGSVSPTKAPVNTRGPNLAGLDKSMRKAWFTRWVADPLRVVPRVEMPAITVPINGVLDDDLDRQIDAVWHVLNLEGFRPPKPDPVRVVRQSGLDASARVHLLTDVLRLGDDQYIKPLLVGLPNRHNVLIDLSENQIAGWWLGDTALQQTEGKTWYWEAGGSNLLDSPSTTASDMVLVTEDTELQPLRRGQFLTELDAWEHTPDGLLVSHRLMFSRDGSAAVTVRLEQRFSATEQNQKPTGWARQIRVDGLPAGNQLRIRPAPSSFQLKGGSLVSGSGAAMRVAIDPTNSDARRQIEFESDGSVLLASDEMVRLRYTTELPVDILTIPGSSIELSKTVLLDVVPGFTATELALPGDVLPTGLSWDSNGTLFVSELKGRVIRVIDSDLDGMPDKANTFGDELAAPFGLKAHDGYVDVINKYALLRLHDADNDGTAERVETLASGWGHTADYHDWAVGLPQTPTGEYLAAFPCQQDDRSQAAANLRGTVVRLIPQQPTADNPHRFRIDTLTAGHRFPIGIARNRAGDLFVTDNQGNYNPFNELNHIVPGKRYGFINKLDRSPDFNPPLTPPAIDIPHPWTRSVNGICFLETPPDLEDSVFGPFEGHLVGCEYDTRRLIRMSLQRVGDTIQGAAYPLSYDEPPTGAPMLGPIACAVAPDGAIYIGNLRESGWGAGQNIGGVVRLELDEATLPVGIAEVRAHHDGFSLRFTGDLAARLAEDPANYSIQSYTRESTSQYGGDDIGNRSEVIKSVRYDVGKRTAFVELAELRRGYVYEFNLNHLLADEQAMLFPARAFYTLRSIPE